MTKNSILDVAGVQAWPLWKKKIYYFIIKVVFISHDVLNIYVLLEKFCPLDLNTNGELKLRIDANLTRSSRWEIFSKKGVLKDFIEFTGKHLCWSLRPATLLKKRLHPRCFSVNSVKFLRTSVFTEHLQWLVLLNVIWINLFEVFWIKVFWASSKDLWQ